MLLITESFTFQSVLLTTLYSLFTFVLVIRLLSFLCSNSTIVVWGAN